MNSHQNDEPKDTDPRCQHCDAGCWAWNEGKGNCYGAIHVTEMYPDLMVHFCDNPEHEFD